MPAQDSQVVDGWAIEPIEQVVYPEREVPTRVGAWWTIGPIGHRIEAAFRGEPIPPESPPRVQGPGDPYDVEIDEQGLFFRRRGSLSNAALAALLRTAGWKVEEPGE